MEYKHPVHETPSVRMVPFSLAYKERYRQIYNACFREMREALQIQPFDVIQDDSFFETGTERIFLLTDGDEIIGSVTLKDNEIDDLFVNPAYQGCGFGRQILLWALTHMQTERIILHVAEWNEKAVRLYQKTGFAVTDTAVF
jgi:ribosomal protein S18 acetylase RimI-like enzyme